ncbi:MAG: nucleotidyltransferase family protein [Candidatus Promineifilaceae bacterium]|nr:nucleotidyltransferase family protein [Candidatus Promineifilaceae bacterium]
MLAAGQSRRMGKTKQLLPWGETTVLGQTIENLQQSTVDSILVVSGHEAEAVTAVAAECGVAVVHNPRYATGEMLSSLQAALPHLPADCHGVLVALADQPMVPAAVVDRLLAVFHGGERQHDTDQIVAPIYEGRRGNPVLIGRAFFDELLALPAGAAPRALLQRHPEKVRLVPVESDTILRDLDRPEQYEQERPSTP